MFRHLLIPTDGSELSYKAVCAGVEFAREIGARITAYHALPRPYVSASALDREMHARHEARARELGESALQVVADTATRSGVHCDVALDAPESAYEGIVAAAQARGCDLIYLASHGRTGGPVQILGSVAQKVVALSGVPVLVFRTR